MEGVVKATVTHQGRKLGDRDQRPNNSPLRNPPDVALDLSDEIGMEPVLQTPAVWSEFAEVDEWRTWPEPGLLVKLAECALAGHFRLVEQAAR